MKQRLQMHSETWCLGYAQHTLLKNSALQRASRLRDTRISKTKCRLVYARRYCFCQHAVSSTRNGQFSYKMKLSSTRNGHFGGHCPDIARPSRSRLREFPEDAKCPLECLEISMNSLTMRTVVNTLLECLGILMDSIRILSKIPLECLGIHMNSLGMPIIVNSLWIEIPMNSLTMPTVMNALLICLGIHMNSIESSAKSLWNAVRFLRTPLGSLLKCFWYALDAR